MMWTCQLRCNYLSMFIIGIVLFMIKNAVNGAGELWSLERPDGMPTIQSLEVMCGKDHMDVHLAFSQPFEGIVSSKGQHGDPRCMYVPPSTGQTFFSFKIAYSRCGTKPDLHGQFYENTVVVQYDKDLLEVWDEAKRLRCEWFNDYEKTASKPPMVIADLDVVQLDFRGDNVDCWMEIQHGKGPWAPPVSGIVPLGSTLTLVVAINDYRGEFDMRVKSCIASDGGGHVIELSDEFGCVLRPKMISRFSKAKGVDERASVITYAFFHAFKFPDALSVHIKCKVEICRHGCLDHCQLQQNNNIYETSGVGGGGGDLGLDHDLFLNPLDRKDDDKRSNIKDSSSLDSPVNHHERVYDNNDDDDDDTQHQRNEAISSSSSDQQLSSTGFKMDLNKEIIKNVRKQQSEEQEQEIRNNNNNEDDDEDDNNNNNNNNNNDNMNNENDDDENEVNEKEKNDNDRQYTLGELNMKNHHISDVQSDEDLHAEEIRVIPETHKIKDILDIIQFPHGPRSLRNLRFDRNENNSMKKSSNNDSDKNLEKNVKNKEGILPLDRINRTRRSITVSDRKVRSADVGVSGIYEVISEADLAFSPDNRAEAVAVFQGKIREEVVYGICMPVPGFSILFVLVAVSAVVSALIAGTLLYRYQIQKEHFTTNLQQNENHFISMNIFSNWIGMKLLRPSVYATHLRRPDSSSRQNNNSNNNNNNTATILNKSMCTNRNTTNNNNNNNSNSINNCE